MTKYKQYAKHITIAGIVGLILVPIFYWYSRDSSSGGFSGLIWMKHTTYIITYYVVNSLLLIISGQLLIKRNILGLYLLITAFISVCISMFIQDGSTNLFLWTITSSFYVFFTGAPVGVCYFLSTLFINIIRVSKWYQEIERKNMNQEQSTDQQVPLSYTK